jgi:hypothetical protein
MVFLARLKNEFRGTLLSEFQKSSPQITCRCLDIGQSKEGKNDFTYFTTPSLSRERGFRNFEERKGNGIRGRMGISLTLWAVEWPAGIMTPLSIRKTN